MTYEEWLEVRKQVNKDCDEADKVLKDYTDKFIKNFGLLPDSVRGSEEYKKLKKEFDFRFNDLKYFNEEKTYKKFQKEYHEQNRKERRT